MDISVQPEAKEPDDRDEVDIACQLTEYHPRQLFISHAPEQEVELSADSETGLLGKPQRAAGNYALTLIAQALILSLGMLAGVLAARILGPTVRGQYAAVTIWPIAISSLLAMGVNQAITYNIGRGKFSLSEISTAAAVIGIAQSVLSVLIGLVVVHFALVAYPHAVRHLAAIFVFSTPALLFGVYPVNFFHGKQDMVWFNVIRSIAPAVYAAGVIILVIASIHSLVAVVSVQMAGYVMALVVGLLACRRLRAKFSFNKQAVVELLSYGARTQATNITNYLNQRLDQLLLSLFVPAAELGYYAVAVTLSSAITVFPQAVGMVTFSRGSNQSHEDAKDTIGTSFRASFVWLLIACSLLYVLTPFVIHKVFGQAFNGSIMACRILIPGAFMMGLNQVLYNGTNALGRPGLPSIAEGAGLIVTVVGLCVLVPRYGYIGAAIVSSVAYTVSFLVMLLLMGRKLRIQLTPW